MTVELLGGRGEEFWPWPGRIFAAGPSHTVMDLANAINYASEFEFMFVLGDAWTHRCVVGEAKVDPLELWLSRARLH
ncbi:MAG: hypothetical protein NVS3B6_08690 [Pseudarthrobacter sp.]